MFTLVYYIMNSVIAFLKACSYCSCIGITGGCSQLCMFLLSWHGINFSDHCLLNIKGWMMWREKQSTWTFSLRAGVTHSDLLFFPELWFPVFLGGPYLIHHEHHSSDDWLKIRGEQVPLRCVGMLTDCFVQVLLTSLILSALNQVGFAWLETLWRVCPDS